MNTPVPPFFSLSLFITIKTIEMRFLLLISIGIFFTSCHEEATVSDEENVVTQLLKGEWILMATEKPIKRFQSGLKFSEDNQVFNIDSQGHVVPPHAERIYKIYGDTLAFIDYKYLEHKRYEKGTDILLIKKLNDDEMVLKVIHPDASNELTFKNVNK